jgi:hypothetical protein
MQPGAVELCDYTASHGCLGYDSLQHPFFEPYSPFSGLRRDIRNGSSILAWHVGAVSFQANSVELTHFVGGQ